MKKVYLTPELSIVLIPSVHLLAGSGPSAGDQNNPGLSPAPGLDFSDEELVPDLSGMPGM